MRKKLDMMGASRGYKLTTHGDDNQLFGQKHLSRAERILSDTTRLTSGHAIEFNPIFTVRDSGSKDFGYSSPLEKIRSDPENPAGSFMAPSASGLN